MITDLVWYMTKVPVSQARLLDKNQEMYLMENKYVLRS